MVNRFTRNNRVNRPYYYGSNKMSVPRFKHEHQNYKTFQSHPICRSDTDRDAYGCCGGGCCCCCYRRRIVEQQDRSFNPDLARTNSPKYDNITYKTRHVHEPSIVRNRRNNNRYQQSDVYTSIQQQQQRIRNNNKFRKSQQQRIRNYNRFGYSLQTDTMAPNYVARQKRWHSKKKFDKSLQTDFNKVVSNGRQNYGHGRHNQPLKVIDVQQEIQDDHDGGNQPPPIECDTEEEDSYSNRNSPIYNRSPTYEHGDWKWRGIDYDKPLEEDDNTNHEDKHEITNHRHYFAHLDNDDQTELIETEDVKDLEEEEYNLNRNFRIYSPAYGHENLDYEDEHAITMEYEDVKDDDETETETLDEEEDDLITRETDYTEMDGEEETETNSLSSEEEDSLNPVILSFTEANGSCIYYCIPICEVPYDTTMENEHVRDFEDDDQSTNAIDGDQTETAETLVEEDDLMITHGMDEEQQTETNSLSSEDSSRPVLRMFREANRGLLFYCIPIREVESLPIGDEETRRIASYVFEHIDDYPYEVYWLQGREEDNEEEEDDKCGLSEEAISELLGRTMRVFSKQLNETNPGEDEGEICVICLQEYEDGEIVGKIGCTCGHEYHVECIKKWLLLKNNCPACKYTLVVVPE